MPLESTVQNARIALFIDIENLVGSASTMGLPIDVSPVLEKLKEFGRIQIRRSFGDLEKGLNSIGKGNQLFHVRRMLHQNLIQIEDIPFMTAQKNTADIRLVIEALSIAFQYEEIPHFAILSSDRDYVPLYNKLHELGRTVITIGIDQANTNQMVRDASDRLIYYESLFPDRETNGAQAEADDDTRYLLETYYLLLRQSIRTLENQGMKAVGSAVASLMRQMRSDFSPELVGCVGFKGFIQRAEQAQIVFVTWPDGPGDFVLTVNPEKQLVNKPIVLPQPVIGRDTNHMAEHYRNLLEGKLRISLPSLKGRRQILDALAETYDEMIANGPFALTEWKDRATRYLQQEGVSPKTRDAVFKILLSLYFARCFHCEENSDKNNPTVVGLAHEDALWEHRLHFLMARTILFAIKPDKVAPTALCQVLFDSAENGHLEEVNSLLQEIVGG